MRYFEPLRDFRWHIWAGGRVGWWIVRRIIQLHQALSDSEKQR